MQNTLYFGDNLDILQKHVVDASIDLVYLDPPFNSQRVFNVIFKDRSGEGSAAQIQAFDDTWSWAGAAEAWDTFAELCPVPRLIELMNGFVAMLGKSDLSAYLVMMAPRLYQLHRVLKPTGSLYLHCDTTAAAYLKIVLDALFGPTQFRNEIAWKRSDAHNDAKKQFGAISDRLLFYAKSKDTPFYVLHTGHTDSHIKNWFCNLQLADGTTRRMTKSEIELGTVPPGARRYSISDLSSPNPRPNLMYSYKGYPHPAKGWRCTPERMALLDSEGRLLFPSQPDGRIVMKKFLDEQEGVVVGDIWTDISQLRGADAERLGYPTQKPLALLERILAASSKEGDVVLDPFAGCGTTVAAAQKLNRHWIGIDITPIATSLIQKRLFDSFGAKDARLLSADDPGQSKAFVLEGLPTDTEGARLLFLADHKKFEMWAVGLIPAIPQEKKGGDTGIDGLAYFHDGGKTPSKAVVQVKGGHLAPTQVRDLRGVKEREKAALALFVCLETPTKGMRDEALAAGYYQPPMGGNKVAALQLRTVGELLAGQKFDLPFGGVNVSYKQAPAVEQDTRQQGLELF